MITLSRDSTIVLANLPNQLEAVVIRHHRVGQNEPRKDRRASRSASSASTAPVTVTGVIPPAGDHLFEDLPVDRMIVHDQHAEILQVR